MNTRVKELYAEAVMSVHDAFIDRMLVPSAVDLQFAEMIIRECIRATGNCAGTGDLIKEQFGIES